MRKSKIGSIVEFNTSKGLAYGQLTHTHAQYSDLIRVFEGFYSSRPESFEGVLQQSVRFSAFIPLSSQVRQRMAEVVAQQPVRDDLAAFPLFRAGNYDSVSKTMGPWWLWDGEKRWRVGDLTADELKYPKLGLWNAALIIERLEAGWVAEGSLW